MQKTHLAVNPLRVLLVVAFAVLVAFQVAILPKSFATLAAKWPEGAHLRWPMLAVSVLVLLCVQVVIICTWRLLTMVRDDRIFSEESLGWVDTIVWAMVAAWLLVLGALIYSVLRSTGPGMQIALLLVQLGGSVLVWLMLVMRALLRQATALRTDMDAVI